MDHSKEALDAWMHADFFDVINSKSELMEQLFGDKDAGFLALGFDAGVASLVDHMEPEATPNQREWFMAGHRLRDLL